MATSRTTAQIMQEYGALTSLAVEGDQSPYVDILAEILVICVDAVGRPTADVVDDIVSVIVPRTD